MLMKYSKNQKRGQGLPAAGCTRKENYEKWFDSQKGFATAAHRRVGEAQAVGRGPGHGALQGRGQARPGCSATPDRRTPKAAEVLSKYIIIDMYAKAVQGMPAEDAVKWAEGELKKIYG